MEDSIKLIRTLYRDTKVELIPLPSDLKFICLDDCFECCSSLPVAISESEANELANELLIQNSYSIPQRKGVRIIKKRNNVCIFLKDKKCSIQNKKPYSCRSYPINVDPLTKKIFVDIACPGVGQGKILNKEKLNKMIRYRFKFWNNLNLTEKEKRLIHKEYFIKNLCK